MVLSTFKQFIKESYDSEYANPNHKDHDLWKHAVPAYQDRETGQVLRGQRGKFHDTIHTDDDRSYRRGFYHVKNKTFFQHKDMDSTDLMTRHQLARAELQTAA